MVPGGFVLSLLPCSLTPHRDRAGTLGDSPGVSQEAMGRQHSLCHQFYLLPEIWDKSLDLPRQGLGPADTNSELESFCNIAMTKKKRQVT